MASAAAAPAPKRAQQQPRTKRPWWQMLQGWVAGMWCKTPETFHTELIRRVSGLVEYGIVGAIIAHTKSARSNDEWTSITEKQFSELIGCTEEAAHRALDELERRQFIESRTAGRGKQYRALPENFDQGPERAWQRKPVESDDSPRHVEPRQYTRFSRRNPLRVPKGTTISEIAPEGDDSLEGCFEGTRAVVRAISVENKSQKISAIDGKDNLQIGEHKAKSDGANKRKPELQIGNEKANKARAEKLREWLAPFFVRRLGKPLDDPFLMRIDARLGVATVESFIPLITDALKRYGKRFESGLLLTLADQARKAAEEYARIGPEDWRIGKPLAAGDEVDLHVPRIPPAEDLDSPWARVKLRLKENISPEQFLNWVTETAFISLDGDELRVWVRTAVTKDWMQEEYAGEVAAAIRDLKLPVKSVVYLPGFEIASE